MGSTWALSAPYGTHVGPMNLAIRDCFLYYLRFHNCLMTNALYLENSQPNGLPCNTLHRVNGHSSHCLHGYFKWQHGSMVWYKILGKHWSLVSYSNGLVQNCSIISPGTVAILQSSTNPSIYTCSSSYHSKIVKSELKHVLHEVNHIPILTISNCFLWSSLRYQCIILHWMENAINHPIVYHMIYISQFMWVIVHCLWTISQMTSFRHNSTHSFPLTARLPWVFIPKWITNLNWLVPFSPSVIWALFQ